jgi:hypothetical protein
MRNLKVGNIALPAVSLRQEVLEAPQQVKEFRKNFPVLKSHEREQIVS